MPARAAGGPGLQPVELMISTNSRRISELEARLSASMCVSDEIIQDFQRRLSALQAETARIAAFVDQMHHGGSAGGGGPVRPLLRVIRGDRDNPSILTFDIRAAARWLTRHLSPRPALAALLVTARRHLRPSAEAARSIGHQTG